MLKTFPKGGIHPPENKITADKGIKRMTVPKVVNVPIAQHIGIPAEIVVEKKDKVQIGQVIAKSGGFVSSNIHSPVAGVVTKLDMIIDTSGYKKQCIVIRTDAKDESNFEEKVYPLKTNIELDPAAILQKITANKKENTFYALFFVLVSLLLDGSYLMLEPISVFFQLIGLLFYLETNVNIF